MTKPLAPLKPSDTPSVTPFWRSALLFWVVVMCILIWFLGAVSSILLPFVLGMIIAYCLDPLADRLEVMGLSRTSATALITGAIFSIFALGLIWLLPLLIKQFMGLMSLLPQAFSHVEQYVSVLSNRYLDSNKSSIASIANSDNIKESAFALSEHIFGSGQVLIKEIVSSGAAFLNIMSLLFITPIVSFYALRDWDKMVAHLDALIPLAHRETVRTQCRAIDKTLSGFLRGQLNVMIILTLYYCVVLALIGIPFSLIIGVITGVLIIIPYIGTFVSLALAVASVLLDSGVGTELYLVLGAFLFGHLSEQQFLTPKVIGDEVGLSPLWMLFAMLSGAALFGFVGMLIAVPAAAVIGVVVRFIIALYRKSTYYTGEAMPSTSHTDNAP